MKKIPLGYIQSLYAFSIWSLICWIMSDENDESRVKGDLNGWQGYGGEEDGGLWWGGLMRECEWRVMKVVHPRPFCCMVVVLIYRKELKRFREIVSNRSEEDRVCWDEIVT